jgi:small-conductance mechanosensitive channel
MTIFSLGTGGNQSGSSGGSENSENRELVTQGLALLTQHFQKGKEQKKRAQGEKSDQARLEKNLKRIAQQIRTAEGNNSVGR